MAGFDKLGVLPELLRAVHEMGWVLPTPVQEEAIPMVLGGGDALVAAETGTGKTGAFCLPILQVVYESLQAGKPLDADRKGPSAPKAGRIREKVFLNPLDRDGKLAIGSDGLTAQSRDQRAWNGCRATVGVARGSYCFEAQVTDDGLCRFGWSAKLATLDLGTDRLSFGFGGTGKKSFNKRFDPYGEAFGNGDVITCMIDLDSSKPCISFRKNGNDLGIAFDLPKDLLGTVFYPALVLKNAEAKVNFGPKEKFQFPVPENFSSIAEAIVADLGSEETKREDGARVSPLALILEPTKELALQLDEELTKFKKYLDAPRIHHIVVTGGKKTAIRKGQVPHIVVGTMGKLTALMKLGELDVSDTRFFVLDEADQVIKDQTENEVLSLYAKMPKDAGRHVQVLLFSATLHAPEIKELSDKITNFPTWIDLKGKDSIPETVDHAVLVIDPSFSDIKFSSAIRELAVKATDGIHVKSKASEEESESQAIKILKCLLLKHVIDEFNMESALIFARTRLDCDNISTFLMSCGEVAASGDKVRENAYSCLTLHSSVSASERAENLKSFKNGEIKFLICTDVAARGLDIYGLPYVINVTLPDSPEPYIHRVGRVGRADRIGLAISLVSSVKEKVWYHKHCKPGAIICKNSKLLDEGGCAIWYDEPNILRQIETRLGGVEIPRLDALNIKKGREDASKVYGEIRGDGGDLGSLVHTTQHTQMLSDTVKELDLLETDLQKLFWSMKMKWSKS